MSRVGKREEIIPSICHPGLHFTEVYLFYLNSETVIFTSIMENYLGKNNLSINYLPAIFSYSCENKVVE